MVGEITAVSRVPEILSNIPAEVLSVVLLAVVLFGAVMRPFGWPEAVFAVPPAGLLIVAGAILLDHARAKATRLGPVIGLLAAVLVLAKLCDDEATAGCSAAATATGIPAPTSNTSAPQAPPTC
jgi:arsenical pump membrane protein